MTEDIELIKGTEIRKADFPIESVLLDRWSPRAMSDEEISREELMRLFEAARWAPSSFNAQQWRALYARRGHRALDDVLRAAGRSEQGLGKECSRSCGVHFAKDV